MQSNQTKHQSSARIVDRAQVRATGVIQHDDSNPQLNWPPCSLSYPPLLLLDGKTTQGRGGTSRTEWTAYYQTTDARGAIVLSDGKQEEQASACTVTIN